MILVYIYIYIYIDRYSYPYIFDISPSLFIITGSFYTGRATATYCNLSIYCNKQCEFIACLRNHMILHLSPGHF